MEISTLNQYLILVRFKASISHQIETTSDQIYACPLQIIFQQNWKKFKVTSTNNHLFIKNLP